MNTQGATTRVIDYFVAVRNLSRSVSIWRANAVHALLDATQQLPVAADAAPLVDIAHEMDGIMWSVMESAGIHVPTAAGEVLRREDAIAALRIIAANVVADDFDFQPDFVTAGEVAAIEALDDMVLETSIMAVSESAEMYKTANADLSERLQRYLKNNI